MKERLSAVKNFGMGRELNATSLYLTESSIWLSAAIPD